MARPPVSGTRRTGTRGASSARRRSRDAGAENGLEHWLSYRFALIATRIVRLTAPIYARRHGLSVAHWRGLAVIARFGPLSPSDLGHRILADSVRTSRTVDALLRRGLIDRDKDPADGRRAILRLTRDGWHVFRDIERIALDLEAELRSALPATEHAALHRALDRVEAALSVDRATPATTKDTGAPRQRSSVYLRNEDK